MIACPRCGHPNADGARYCSSCAMALMPPAAPSETRKTVTVMFMDVAGSTALGEHTDPESLRRVMTRYFDEIRSIVEAHGGTVEKYIGDAVMAVFGVPAVHEDDALRAVRAAVEIRARVATLDEDLRRERGLAVQWRTGLNTGEVVAGDAGAGQRFVTGDAVNVAARLEQAAQPGEILLGAETYLLVHHEATVEPVPALDAKGKAEPVPAYRLIDLSGASGGAVPRHASPMVGRQRQRRLLADAFEQVVAERVCHLFTVLGAAGVGKTRLISEFVAGLPDEALVLHGRCLSYGEGITYRPIAEVIREATGVAEGDDDATFTDRISQLVDDEEDRRPVADRIGALLGRFDRQSVAEETAWAVRRLLESIARDRPVVLVLDDVHWATPTLLDLVEHLADWAHDTQLLVICVGRHELLESRPGWGGGKSFATTLTLEPLSDAESRELMGNLLGQADLSSELADRIGAAAEGNPLFVEEMIEMLVDHGYLIRGEHGWDAAPGLGQAALPPTIQALLAARLDRLPAPERTVIDRGAVEGKVFHPAAVVELVPDELRAAVPLHLRALSRKELVRPDRSDLRGLEAFRFRHLLIRDAAYAALPKQARAELHARFASWLEGVLGDKVADYHGVLGYHLAQAHHYWAELGPLDAEGHRLGRDAAHHLAAAGSRALAVADVAAAVQLLGAALELTPLERHERFRVAADLGLALIARGELRRADSLLESELERAREMGDELGAAYIEVAFLGNRNILGGPTIAHVIDRGRALLDLFDRSDDVWGKLRAASMLGQYEFYAGNGRVAADLLKQRVSELSGATASAILIGSLQMALYWGPGTVEETTQALDSFDMSASRILEAQSMRVRGALCGLVGDFEQGRALLRRAADIERDLGRRIMVDATLGHFLGPLEMLAGDYAEAEAVLVPTFEAMTSRGDLGYSSTVAGNLAALHIAQGRIDAAERFARIAVDTSSTDDAEAQAQGLSALARVQAARGDHAAAEASIAHAVAVAEGTDFLMRRGWVQSDLAEVLLAAGKHGDARAAQERAVALFEAKGATWVATQARRRLKEMNAERAVGAPRR